MTPVNEWELPLPGGGELGRALEAVVRLCAREGVEVDVTLRPAPVRVDLAAVDAGVAHTAAEATIPLPARAPWTVELVAAGAARFDIDVVLDET